MVLIMAAPKTHVVPVVPRKGYKRKVPTHYHTNRPPRKYWWLHENQITKHIQKKRTRKKRECPDAEGTAQAIDNIHFKIIFWIYPKDRIPKSPSTIPFYSNHNRKMVEFLTKI